MFKNKELEVKKPTGLELEVDRILKEMQNVKVTSEEYKAMVARLQVLCEAKEREIVENTSLSPWRSISPDTIVTVAGSLLGIMIIVWHEKADVITSKALSFVLKGRV